MTISGSYHAGADINYYPSAGLAPFNARSQDATAGVQFRPGSRTRFDETYVFSRLAGPATVFVKSSAPLQSELPTHALALAARDSRIQRGAPERTPGRSRTRQAYQCRLPDDLHTASGTAIYFGYGDRLENLLPPVYRQRTPVPGYSTGRQVFVKVSYLIRL